MVAVYSDALPYAIVPNGNGVNPGTPYGNNPSGSALGEATQGTDAFQVNDWAGYLSSAFGRGINPKFDGNVNRLYSFSLQGQTGLRGSTSSCEGSGPLRSFSGLIQTVGGSFMDVRLDNGQQYRVNLSPCTQLAANQQGYQPHQGDALIFQGH